MPLVLVANCRSVHFFWLMNAFEGEDAALVDYLDYH
jgi:hypothetical protein